MEEDNFPEFNWGDDESRLRKAARAVLNFATNSFRGKPDASAYVPDNVRQLFPEHNMHQPIDWIEKDR